MDSKKPHSSELFLPFAESVSDGTDPIRIGSSGINFAELGDSTGAVPRLVGIPIADELTVDQAAIEEEGRGAIVSRSRRQRQFHYSRGLPFR